MTVNAGDVPGGGPEGIKPPDVAVEPAAVEPAIDPAADALAAELGGAADPTAAIEAGAREDTSIEQAAANGAPDLDLGNASDDEVLAAAERELADRVARPDELDIRTGDPNDPTGEVVDDGVGLDDADEDEPPPSPLADAVVDAALNGASTVGSDGNEGDDDLPGFLKGRETDGTNAPAAVPFDAAASSPEGDATADGDLTEGTDKTDIKTPAEEFQDQLTAEEPKLAALEQEAADALAKDPNDKNAERRLRDIRDYRMLTGLGYQPDLHTGLLVDTYAAKLGLAPKTFNEGLAQRLDNEDFIDSAIPALTPEEQLRQNLGAQERQAAREILADPTNTAAVEKLRDIKDYRRVSESASPDDPLIKLSKSRLEGKLGLGPEVPAPSAESSTSRAPRIDITPARAAVDRAAAAATPTQSERWKGLQEKTRYTSREARDYIRLRDERARAIKLSEMGSTRTAAEDAEFQALEGQWSAEIPRVAVDREGNVNPLKSEQQIDLDKLQKKKSLTPAEVEKMGALEASQKRYRELSDKDNLNADEEKERDQLEGQWGDPQLRAAESEVLGQIDKSLESPESFAQFAQALETYSHRKSGASLHQAVENGMKVAITEYFNRKQTELSPAENRALKRVQELLKGMQQEIVIIMTFKKQLEAQVKVQEKLVKEVKKQQTLVDGNIAGDDQVKQREAFRLTALYNKLAITNANIVLTLNRATDANFNFRRRQRLVKKQLGLGGFGNDVAILADQFRRLSRWAGRNASLVGQNLPLSQNIAI